VYILQNWSGFKFQQALFISSFNYFSLMKTRFPLYSFLPFPNDQNSKDILPKTTRNSAKRSKSAREIIKKIWKAVKIEKRESGVGMFSISLR
jgi:hypothetical protein